MSDENRSKSTDEPNETGGEPRAPKTLRVPYKGQEIEVPYERGIELARDGFAAAQVRKSLKDEREQFERERQQHQDAVEWDRFLKEHPDHKKAIAAYLSGRARIVAAGEEQRRSSERDDDDDPDDRRNGHRGNDRAVEPPEDPRASVEQYQRERRIQQLEAEIEAIKGEKTASRLQQQVDTELDAIPWLQGEGKLKEMARNQTLQYLSQHEGEPIAAVVATVAADFREILEERAREDVERQRVRGSIKSVLSSGGIPSPPPKEKKGTSSELRDGSFRERLFKRYLG